MRVYRLVTANAIESRIVERANAKKKLGHLVLASDGKKKVKSIDDLMELLSGELTEKVGQGEIVTDDQLFVWD